MSEFQKCEIHTTIKAYLCRTATGPSPLTRAAAPEILPCLPPAARTKSARLRSCAACNEGVRACRILLSADLLGFHFFCATLQTPSYFFPSRNTGALGDYCHSPPACHTPCFQVWSLWGDCRLEPLWKINGRQERAKKTGQMALSPPPAWCHESSSVPSQMPLCSTDLLWSWSNCTLGSCLSSFL